MLARESKRVPFIVEVAEHDGKLVMAAVLEMTKDHTYKVTLKAASPAAKALQMYVGVCTPTHSAYLFIGKNCAPIQILYASCCLGHLCSLLADFRISVSTCISNLRSVTKW